MCIRVRLFFSRQNTASRISACLVSSNLCIRARGHLPLPPPGPGPAEIALLLGPVHRTFVICESLGTARERVLVLTSDTVSQHQWTDPNLLLVIGGGPPRTAGEPGWLAGAEPGGEIRPRGWGLAPADYDLPDPGPVPDAPGRDRRLRALELAVLGPRVGDLLWDVGTGDGLTAVEAARLGSAVIAVDRDTQALAAAEATARRLGVQLHTVNGVAPQVLEDLPEPDVIRVGGGGPRTLGACADRRPQRIVTHVMTRDQAEAAGRVLSGAGFAVECTLVQSVELATQDWSERGRTVGFLLAGRRSHP